MDFTTVILLSIAIILIVLIVKYLYSGIIIEYFSEELPEPVQELLKMQIQLGEKAQKIQDAIDKINTASQAPYTSTDSTQQNTTGIFDRAKRDNKTPIFDFIAFNKFIKDNPQPSLQQLIKYIGNEEIYNNLIDVLYIIIKDEMERMNSALKETFIGGNTCSLKEGFRSVCFDIPNDAPPIKCSDSTVNDHITPQKLKELVAQANRVINTIKSPENKTKLLFIDKSFELLNTMKKKGDNTQEFINEYAPNARQAD